MAKFRASKVEKIEWDVQGAPKLNADGKVDGKWKNGEPYSTGEIPEPDADQVQAFSTAYADHLRSMEGITLENLPEDLYATSRATASQLMLGLGFPEELLDYLPPRHFRALCEHVYGDLTGEAATVA